MSQISLAQRSMMTPSWQALQFIKQLRLLVYRDERNFDLIEESVDWDSDANKCGGRVDYVAVSYCWADGEREKWEKERCGSEGEDYTIWITDRTTSKAGGNLGLHITSALSHDCDISIPPGTSPNRWKSTCPSSVLLRAARFAQHHGIRRIWLDKECIPQCNRASNDKEYSGTIQSMHYVYRKARFTLVVLGECADCMEDVREVREWLGMLRLKKKECEESVLGQEKMWDDGNRQGKWQKTKGVREKIRKEKWFTRAWCTQEYLVSPVESLIFLVGCKMPNLKLACDNPQLNSGIMMEYPDTFGEAHISYNYGKENPVLNSVPTHYGGDCEFGFEEMQRLVPDLMKNLGLLGNTEGKRVWEGMHRLCEIDLGEGVDWGDGGSRRSKCRLQEPSFSDSDIIPWKDYRSDILEICSPVLVSLYAIMTKENTRYADRLAIIANLCNYRWRLDTAKVTQANLSFSAALIALALYNGDISFIFTNFNSSSSSSSSSSDGRNLNSQSVQKEYSNDTSWKCNHNVEIAQWLPPEDMSLHRLAQAFMQEQEMHPRINLKPHYGHSCIVIEGHLVISGILWSVATYHGLDGLRDMIRGELRKLPNTNKPPNQVHQNTLKVYQCCFAIIVREIYCNSKGESDILELLLPAVMILNSLTDLIETVEDIFSVVKKHLELETGIDELAANIVEILDIDDNQCDTGRLSGRIFYPEALCWVYETIAKGKPLIYGSSTIGSAHNIHAIFELDTDNDIFLSANPHLFTPIHNLDYNFGYAQIIHANKCINPAVTCYQTGTCTNFNYSWHVHVDKNGVRDDFVKQTKLTFAENNLRQLCPVSKPDHPESCCPKNKKKRLVDNDPLAEKMNVSNLKLNILRSHVVKTWTSVRLSRRGLFVPIAGVRGKRGGTWRVIPESMDEVWWATYFVAP